MYECPWCTHKSFSFWQKQSLGPNRTLRCGNCRRHVSVPWGRAHLAAIPLFLCAVAGLWFIGDAFNSKLIALAGAFAGVAIGMVLTMPLYHAFVPLVKPHAGGRK
ncbi:MAG TPA: hypothetical protein VN782_12435 [Usitatibacter sp.]|nr:hypothetical protein [Usitatibacter sp.]